MGSSVPLISPREHPEPKGPAGPARLSPRARYRFHRRHRVHYYFVLTGITCAVGVCVLNTVAYETKSLTLAIDAFAAILLTSAVIFSAFFWGFYMVMSGHIPVKRLRYLLPHAAVGTLSPLLYTLNIAAALDGLGSEPVSLPSLIVSYLCVGLLGIQFTMGKLVVRPEPLRLVTQAGIQRINL